MTEVFLLWHVHEFDDGHEDLKVIGVYSTRAKAESGLSAVRHQPGFCDLPGGFVIGECRLDPIVPGWSEGYATQFPDGTISN